MEVARSTVCVCRCDGASHIAHESVLFWKASPILNPISWVVAMYVCYIACHGMAFTCMRLCDFHDPCQTNVVCGTLISSTACATALILFVRCSQSFVFAFHPLPRLQPLFHTPPPHLPRTLPRSLGLSLALYRSLPLASSLFFCHRGKGEIKANRL